MAEPDALRLLTAHPAQQRVHVDARDSTRAGQERDPVATIATVSRQRVIFGFEVRDWAGALVAVGRRGGIRRRRYTVTGPDNSIILDVRVGFLGRHMAAALSGGRTIDIRRVGLFSRRPFELHGPSGVVGRMTPTTGVMTLHPDSYAVELVQPVMSTLEVHRARAGRSVSRQVRAPEQRLGADRCLAVGRRHIVEPGRASALDR